MKTYPSIPGSTGQAFRQFPAYVFDKLDGSNLRFEWKKRKHWHKQGTRTRLFDRSDPIFGVAIEMFMKKYADDLAKIFKKQRWESCIVFCEFWGPGSFAGLHHETVNHDVTLFDVAPYKQGLLAPKDYLKLFGHLDIAKFLGQHNWTHGFEKRIWNNELDGVTHEGVIGKSKQGRHDLVMAKAKTEDWIMRVRAQYSGIEAEKIINS